MLMNFLQLILGKRIDSRSQFFGHLVSLPPAILKPVTIITKNFQYYKAIVLIALH